MTPATAALDDDIGRAFDYNTIIQGIKSTIVRGHINLVETLAEDVARQCLAIRGPRGHRQNREARQGGAVGVEIVRSKGGV